MNFQEIKSKKFESNLLTLFGRSTIPQTSKFQSWFFFVFQNAKLY